jgi:hypothetical protein
MTDLPEHGSLGVRELQSPIQLALQDAVVPVTSARMRVQSITVPLPRLLSLNGGAIDRPKNVPDGLQNRYPAVDKWPCSLPFQFFDLTGYL